MIYILLRVRSVWYYIVHLTVKDFTLVKSAWREGVQNYINSVPDEIADKAQKLIQAHKDNLYTKHYYYDGISKKED